MGLLKFSELEAFADDILDVEEVLGVNAAVDEEFDAIDYEILRSAVNLARGEGIRRLMT